MQSILGKLVLLLDGAWNGITASVESTRWFFASSGEVLLVVGGILGLALAVISYVRTTEGITPGTRVFLAAVRFVAVFCLLLVVSGAVCRVRLADSNRPELLVLVDDSPSMQLPLPQGGKDRSGNVTKPPTRLDVAEQTLKGVLAARLQSSFTVRTMHTSDALGRAADGAPDGAPQSLAEAVVRASTACDQRAPLAQMLLISDGSQIGQAPLAGAALSAGTPVSTVDFGNAASVSDVMIHSATVPPFVYHRDRTMVAANVRSLGMEGEAVVKLFAIKASAPGKPGTAADETEVASTKVALKPDGTLTPARVEFAAENAGLQRYVLRLNPMPGELTDANNALHFHLDVRQDKLRVLAIEGNPGWEYKWIRRALEADPAVEFYGLVRLPPDEWFSQGPKQRPDGKPVLSRAKDGFPANTEEMTFFDTVILGDVERKILEQTGRYEMLRNYVLQSGGGLGTIGGISVYAAGNYDGSPLARLLPVLVEREKKEQLINRFNVQLTGRGMMHPIMQLEYDPVKNADAWGKLPWVEGGNAWRRVKPGATTLLVHPTLRTSFGPRPVSAAWQCGRGRVFSSVLDGTWHWSLARETDVDYHRRFWGLAVRWLAGDVRFVRGNTLVLETPVCEVGKPVSVATVLRTETGMPISDADLAFGIDHPDGGKLKVHGASDPASPGCYRLTFDPTTAGAFTVSMAAKLGDGTEKKGTLGFAVSPSREEFLNVAPDSAALAALATATGGTTGYVGDPAAVRLPPTPRQTVSSEKTVALWHAPGVVCLIVGCLGVEWFLRKRRGLA